MTLTHIYYILTLILTLPNIGVDTDIDANIDIELYAETEISINIDNGIDADINIDTNIGADTDIKIIITTSTVTTPPTGEEPALWVPGRSTDIQATGRGHSTTIF